MWLWICNIISWRKSIILSDMTDRMWPEHRNPRKVDTSSYSLFVNVLFRSFFLFLIEIFVILIFFLIILAQNKQIDQLKHFKTKKKKRNKDLKQTLYHNDHNFNLLDLNWGVISWTWNLLCGLVTLTTLIMFELGNNLLPEDIQKILKFRVS